MARTIRHSSLDNRAARARLLASGKPYYRVIDSGLHLGYRKGQRGGKWVVRWYIGKQDYRVETIATADDIIDADGAEVLNFSQAQAVARKTFNDRNREQAGLPALDAGPYTVKTCVENYLAWMETHRKSAADSRYKAHALILPELGGFECAKLTATAIQKWLEGMAASGARLRSTKGKASKRRPVAKDPESIRRRRATANRTLTILKAALNRAWADEKIGSDGAWRRVKPFRDVSAARIRYLTVAECNRLINASAKDFRSLVQGALTTGARYGELCALNVEDYNPDSEKLHILTSKSGKSRHVVLNAEGAKFFAALSSGHAHGEPMFKKEDGSRWASAHQVRPMQDASKGARIEPPTNFHCLRHTYASLAIMNGAPLLVVAKNLGHADTRMVEKHYGHLAPSFIDKAIRAAAPKFGFKTGNVAALEAARR